MGLERRSMSAYGCNGGRLACRRAGHPARRNKLTYSPNRPAIRGAPKNRALFPGVKAELEADLPLRGGRCREGPRGTDPSYRDSRCVNLRTVISLMLSALLAGCAPQPRQLATPGSSVHQPGLVKSEFIFETAPFASSHASTIVETKEGLLAAWFGGPHERHPEVAIWTARYDGHGWSPPVPVADGIQTGGQTRYPCWNPVLFHPKHGPLLLFFKVGLRPSEWWGMLMSSTDDGRTWSKPRRLPDGQVGPVRNKPVELPDGSLLCGASTEDKGWRIHMEHLGSIEFAVPGETGATPLFRPGTDDTPYGWERTPPLNDGKESSLIQPTILQWPSGKTQILCRSKQGKVFESWMGDGWKSWGPIKPTLLPNPNSAIDSVMLKDGRALLVYNHAPRGRSPLNVAISKDGKRWQAALVLENEPGEYSYPAVIQTSDGLVHATYTWKRERIKHVVIDPAKLRLRDMSGGQWPK